MFGRKRIYLDYASATPMHESAEREMMRVSRLVGNPSALHAEGVEAARALEGARGTIAHVLGCKMREIIFTSGGTEANNLAILGLARKLERSKRGLSGTHWAVSSIEHPSVLESFAEIERLGGAVTHIEPDPRGIISPETVEKALKKETVCVSVGWANNEIGVVQPLGKIARVIRAFERANPMRDPSGSHGAGKTHIVFHSDAGQAPLYLPTTVHTLGVDMLTLDSAKLYGPRGAGALFIAHTVAIAPIGMGGGQERGLRPGTENVALAAGFAQALTELAKDREAEGKRVRTLRDTLLKLLAQSFPDMLVNGDIAHALPHMLNISLPNIQSEYITLALDHAGIAISTKSACREGEERRSHVVEALVPPARREAEGWRVENTLRFSLGEDTSESDIKKAATALSAVVGKSRA